MEAFNAVRSCGSNQAAKLNQVNIVKYIINYLIGGKQTSPIENKSYFGFYETTPEFGKSFVYHKNK